MKQLEEDVKKAQQQKQDQQAQINEENKHISISDLRKYMEDSGNVPKTNDYIDMYRDYMIDEFAYLNNIDSSGFSIAPKQTPIQKQQE
jgi:hypothetical protein